MSPRPKNPSTPPSRLDLQDAEVLTLVGRQLARIALTTSPYALPWGGLRTWGPVQRCRWDPHPPPAGEHPGHGVLYTACDLMTCAAEVFADTRVVDTRSDSPVLQVWQPTRPLRLLDLTSRWALRNGASVSLDSAERATCRAWARAVHDQLPALDGLWVRSTMTGQAMTVLLTPAADSIPALPDQSAPLADPTIHALLCELAPDIGYEVV